MKTAGHLLVLLLLVIPILIVCSCGANEPDDEPETHDARLAVVPSIIDFGAVPVGLSVDSSFSIIMAGSYYTHRMGGEVSLPANCDGFAILSGAGPFTVNTFWDSVVVRVRCQPAGPGLKVCDVSTGPSSPTVALRCTAFADTCLCQPSDIYFGTVAVGSSRDTTFTITMAGLSPGPYSGSVDFLIPSPDFSIISGGGSFLLDDLSDTVFVTVRFEPTGSGYEECIVTTNSVCGSVMCRGFGAVSGEPEWKQAACGVTADLNGVGGFSDTDVIVVGDSTTVLKYVDVLQFERVVAGSGDHDYMDVYAFNPDYIWVGSRPYMTDGAQILLFNSPSFNYGVIDEDALVATYNTVWGPSWCDVYFMGRSRLSIEGHNAKFYDDCGKLDSIQVDLAGTAINGVWGSKADDVWAAVSQPFAPFTPVWHYDGGSWSNGSEVWMDQPLYDVWADPGGEAFAVGAAGTVYYFNGSAWADQSIAGLTRDLRGVWGSFPSDVFAVGEDAVIYHFDGSAWSPHSAPPGVTSTLNAVWGTSGTHVYAVGDGGTILHYGL